MLDSRSELDEIEAQENTENKSEAKSLSKSSNAYDPNEVNDLYTSSYIGNPNKGQDGTGSSDSNPLDVKTVYSKNDLSTIIEETTQGNNTFIYGSVLKQSRLYNDGSPSPN